MALPNIFTKEVAEAVIDRINKLTPDMRPQWGSMSVDQMLAHCNVTYEYVYEEGRYQKPKGMMKLMLKFLVKPLVVNEKPYKPSSPTAPDFKIAGDRDFNKEKERLSGFIRKVQAEGADSFEGRVSHSFGKLNKTEWNNMFYKHLDHHLRQFGV